MGVLLENPPESVSLGSHEGPQCNMQICALLLQLQDIYSMGVGTQNAHVQVPILQS